MPAAKPTLRTTTMTLTERANGNVTIVTKYSPPLKKGETPSNSCRLAAAMQLHIVELQKAATNAQT